MKNAEIAALGLDKGWRTTCCILLGQEIGGLEVCRSYLAEMVKRPLVAHSASGKEVRLAQPYYCEKAPFIALEELSGNAPALDINQIKDIDSLLSSLKERLQYCGNNNIGISSAVEDSDSCIDSVCVKDSLQIMKSKNVAYSYGIRQGENVYGSMWCGDVSFCIRCHGLFHSGRCFESYLSINSHGLFFSFNCRNCNEALFSFNQASKQYLVGNLALPKEKYTALKGKLLAEVAEKLAKEGRFPSLFGLVGEKNG